MQTFASISSDFTALLNFGAAVLLISFGVILALLIISSCCRRR